ncbi:MAG: LD-carboxypeptidase [Planctomycetota bacterium]|nr:LD-carboxypeptidase [Planctomycetota bacterium]
MSIRRRQLIAGVSLSALAFQLRVVAFTGQDELGWIAPPALREDDKVVFVAPAGPVDSAKVETARRTFETQGLEVVVPRSLASRSRGYLAGSDAERLEELNNAIADPNIAGIFPFRGGYGLTRILDRIDYEGLRKHPKIVAGFSDITALHLAIAKKSRLITFHSPMPQAYLYDKDEENPVVTNSFWGSLLRARYTVERAKGYSIELPENGLRPKMLVGGRAKGRLLGGNLTLLCSTLGTPFQVDFRGSILFIEDVDEAPYRIDRYLSQLRLTGILDDVSGIIVGTLTDSLARESTAQSACQDIFEHYFADLGVPVITNFPVGHTRLNLTIPHGAEAELDADETSLRILERTISPG